MNLTTHKIFNLCEHHNIQLLVIHLPSVKNNRTDCLSCLYPQHEWGIAHHIFKSINQRWGPHTIDHMATTVNAKLPHFNSHFWEARLEAVDAISQDWRGETNWVAPLLPSSPKSCTSSDTRRPTPWSSLQCGQGNHGSRTCCNFHPVPQSPSPTSQAPLSGKGIGPLSCCTTCGGAGQPSGSVATQN